MGHRHASDPRHHHGDAEAVRCLVIVISDTRSLADDEAGLLIVGRLEAAGHQVVGREILTDDVDRIRTRLLRAAEEGEADAILLTGGTGLGHRDLTPEAIEPMLTRRLPGFGEAMRRISYDEIGARGLLSRALAGVIDRSLVFALPGSPASCATAMDRLVLEMLPHAVGLVRKR